MKFDNLCKDAQEYIDRCIRGTPLPIEEAREKAMKDNLIMAVCKAYENGELDKKSNFDVRKENVLCQQ